MIMMAVSSIHVVVRAMDDLSILMFRNTWALQVVPLKHFGFVESCPAHDACKGVEAFYTVDAERGFIITAVCACAARMPAGLRCCARLFSTSCALCVTHFHTNFDLIGVHHHCDAGHPVQRD